MPDERSRTPGGGVVSGEIEEDTIRRSPLGRAVRDTQRTAQGTADRVDSLRRELGGRIDQLDGKVDDLALTSARVEGQVGVLVDELKAARTIRVSAVSAAIEVEKTGEIAKVEDAADEKKFKRRRELKLMAIVGTLATTIATLVTLLASKC